MVAPELRLTGEVDDLSLAMMPVGALRVDLAYANSLFSLQRLELTEGDHVSEAKGYFPFHLDLMPFSAEPTDWPEILARVSVILGVNATTFVVGATAFQVRDIKN